MNHFLGTFLSQEPYQYSVESNWQQLKIILLPLVELYVPHKTINPYKDLPWMNKNIKAQIKEMKEIMQQGQMYPVGLGGIGVSLHDISCRNISRYYYSSRLLKMTAILE